MARVSDVLYVLGSHGNNSSDVASKPARRVLFTAAIADRVPTPTLTFVGKDNGLRDAMQAPGTQPTATASASPPGRPPASPGEQHDGFNIEGFELAPGSTDTGYLAFRAPLVTQTASRAP